MTNSLTVIITWLQLILTVSSVVTVLYAFARFMAKPNRSQNERLDTLESQVKRLENMLGNDDQRLKEMEDGNRITQQALLALMSHAINGNDVDRLKSAKDELERYLIRK